MNEREMLCDLQHELERFLKKLRARKEQIDEGACSCDPSQIRGELKHRAVIIRNMLSQYRRGEY